jgi:predicted ester cyclase
MMSKTLAPPDVARIAERAIQAVIDGTAAALAAVVHPHAVNRESIDEPPATRGVGPAAFHATGAWLRAAFSDLAWTTERHVVEGDVVVTYGTLSGRQTGDFVVWAAQGTVGRAFAPTGKTFEVHQAHFQRIVDGLVIEHWAVRDDQGMALQLGWIPPTPGFLLRSHRATKRARRLARSANAHSTHSP